LEDVRGDSNELGLQGSEPEAFGEETGELLVVNLVGVVWMKRRDVQQIGRQMGLC